MPVMLRLSLFYTAGVPPQVLAARKYLHSNSRDPQITNLAFRWVIPLSILLILGAFTPSWLEFWVEARFNVGPDFC